jgi:hypothetical protein
MSSFIVIPDLIRDPAFSLSLEKVKTGQASASGIPDQVRDNLE